MDKAFGKNARTVIEIEAQAIAQLNDKIDDTFDACCELLLNCKGRVVVMGMGKSGHIAGKIAASLASTGTPAFFIHPAEACHGDFGMIKNEDVIIAISNSGKSDEIITLLPLIDLKNIPLIVITADAQSPMARAATHCLDIQVGQEACPLGLAPTTSTTATLVMGDALAVALLKARNFGTKDFALSHPGGALGRKLLLKVKDIAHLGEDVPIVYASATIGEALIEVTQKKLGMACVVASDEKLNGVFTDGDVRRAINDGLDVHTTSVSKIMSSNSLTIHADALAAEALKLIQENEITSLVITDEQDRPKGVIHVHDLLKAGLR